MEPMGSRHWAQGAAAPAAVERTGARTTRRLPPAYALVAAASLAIAAFQPAGYGDAAWAAAHGTVDASATSDNNTKEPPHDPHPTQHRR